MSKRNSFEPKHRASSKGNTRSPDILAKSGKKAKNKRLKEISSTYDKDKRQQARQEFEHRRARVYGETSYAARSWDRERRVIARCDYTDSGLEVRYVVTNLTGYQARQVYEDVYCRRGPDARCGSSQSKRHDAIGLVAASLSRICSDC
ncbi:MAG: transposase [Candidatus Obscuribacter sp.]|nr:transposase [Candidatus Obscuribacter sp.]